MWYYIEEDKKQGPVSDTMIPGLYRRGTITLQSKVWPSSEGKWLEFHQTKFFKQMNARKESKLSSLIFDAKIFRAFISANMIVVAMTLAIDISRFNHFADILNGKFFPQIMLNVIATEYNTYSFLMNVSLFVILVFMIYFFARWLYRTSSVAQILDKSFSISPRFAAFSVLIPFVNLLHPFSVVINVYKASKVAAGSHFNIYDFCFIALWFFCTFFSLTVFLVDKFLLQIQTSLDKIKAIIVFDIFSTLAIIFTSVLWILLVSRIYHLQRKALRK